MTVPDLARELSVSPNWLFQRTRKNAVPGLRRLGKHVRIDRREFYEALEAGQVI